MHASALALALLSAAPGQDAPAAPCIAQPLPPAIDSAGALPIASQAIEFAATPSLEYSGRAWVVRLTRRANIEAQLEIVQLRRRLACNRYDVEHRWASPLRLDEVDAVAAAVTPLGTPPAGLLAPEPTGDLDLVADGTEVQLRLRSGGWQVTRTLTIMRAAARPSRRCSASCWQSTSPPTRCRWRIGERPGASMPPRRRPGSSGDAPESGSRRDSQACNGASAQWKSRDLGRMRASRG